MNYSEATRYLLSLGNEVRVSASDSVHVAKLGLENVVELLSAMDRPQDSYLSVLIAGTNGKGSVAAMLDSVLRARSKRMSRAAGTAESILTGLYTSPHLVEITERIRVNGTQITPQEFGDLFTFLHGTIERLLASGRLRFHPTYFECVTAMAMEYFRRRKCDIVVFEVGLGGRLDATNTVTPLVSAITEIDFDHERFLGNTIEKIAGEKAGIIKRGAVVVTSASHPDALGVIRQKAAEEGARLVVAQDEYNVTGITQTDGCYGFEVEARDGWRLAVTLSLRGRHQVSNAMAAIAAARELSEKGIVITDGDLQEGLASTIWPGRMELICKEPKVYLDGAHNPSGAKALIRFWQDHYADKRMILVYGAMRDKAVAEIAEILFPYATTVVLTQPRQERAALPETIRELAFHLNSHFICESDPETAAAKALSIAGPEDLIFITGSLFLVGDIKRRWPDDLSTEPLTTHESRLTAAKQ